MEKYLNRYKFRIYFWILNHCLEIGFFVELIDVNEGNGDVRMSGFTRNVYTQFAMIEKVEIVVRIFALVVHNDEIPAILQANNNTTRWLKISSLQSMRVKEPNRIRRHIFSFPRRRRSKTGNSPCLGLWRLSVSSSPQALANLVHGFLVYVSGRQAV